MPRRKRLLLFLASFALLCWLNNTSLFARADGHIKILAHRGLAQTFPMDKLQAHTNTAAIIYPPEHPYLENTLPSIAAAFAYGADIVEIDIQRSKDNHLVLYHDDTLAYRSNASGSVADYTLAELKRLDIGYGYTADHGKTWPFRGHGIGLIPTLAQALDAHPGKAFLLDLKHLDEQGITLLDQYLRTLPNATVNTLAYYGGDAQMEHFARLRPDARILSKQRLKKALLHYQLVGWSGYIPHSMRNTQLHIPLRYARFLWGFPHTFMARMESVNTRVVLVAGDGTWSEGFDSRAALAELPAGYRGHIWTNRIDRLHP